MLPAQSSTRDKIRLTLDLAYGPDPHNLKVADAIVDHLVAALRVDPSHDVQAAASQLDGGRSS